MGKPKVGFWRKRSTGIAKDVFKRCIFDPKPGDTDTPEAKLEQNRMRPCVGSGSGEEDGDNVTMAEEKCNEGIGYQTTCKDREAGGVEMICRLCATCMPGYKRSGNPGECKP